MQPVYAAGTKMIAVSGTVRLEGHLVEWNSFPWLGTRMHVICVDNKDERGLIRTATADDGTDRWAVWIQKPLVLVESHEKALLFAARFKTLLDEFTAEATEKSDER